MTNFKNPFSPEIISQIKASLERYEALQKNNGFIKLANLGWYINGKMTLAQAAWLMNLAIEEEIVTINNYLISHYNKEMELRAKFIEKSNSKRCLIIKEGIDCHLLEKYNASVSLFLSQADGICKGLLFKTREKKKELKKFVDEKEDNKFFEDILKTILRVNKIDEYFSKDSDSSTGLNRHAVLHGYDTDFGTELNSLKAFSLLLFVKDFLANKTLT